MLINSNLVGIPQYIMQCIKISKYIAKICIENLRSFSSRITWIWTAIIARYLLYHGTKSVDLNAKTVLESENIKISMLLLT